MIDINTISLTDREVYDFYRKHRRYISKTIDQYNYYVKAVHGILNIMKAMMYESEGGIYIAGLGYFCMVEKGKRKRGKSLLLKKATLYRPYFFPDREFKEWAMDRNFDKVFNLTEKPEQYKQHFGLCKSIREASEFAIKEKNSK